MIQETSKYITTKKTKRMNTKWKARAEVRVEKSEEEEVKKMKGGDGEDRSPDLTEACDSISGGSRQPLTPRLDC